MASTKHYIVRTSWVVGDGKNFIKTMALADRISPSVVSTRWSHLTFTADLAQGIHLLTDRAPWRYNLSGEGPVASWAQVASRTSSELCGRDPGNVTGGDLEEVLRG